MKILLIGKTGQIGYSLFQKLKSTHELIAPDRSQLDLLNNTSMEAQIDSIGPDIIINAAAYTDVDYAESNECIAYQANAEAPSLLAKKSMLNNIPIIHFSSDYIFDGLKESPYLEDDVPNPKSIYGRTKLMGEEATRQNPKHYILRTSWVFSEHGNNFIKSMLKLFQEKKILYVVNDQWGAPTSTDLIGHVIDIILSKAESNVSQNYYGTYHLACQGKTSWHGYAEKILELIRLHDFKLNIKTEAIHPISTISKQSIAQRPANSVFCLDKIKHDFKIDLPDWKNEVDSVICNLLKSENY